MKNLFKASLLSLLLLSSLFITACFNDSASSTNEPEKNAPEKKVLPPLEYDGKTEDLTGLTEMYRENFDMNRDNIKDLVLVYREQKNDSFLRGKYIVIIDGKDNKTLTTITLGMLDTNIADIKDLDNDGIYEIHMEFNSGGTAGGGSYLLTYNNKTYHPLKLESPKLKTTFESGYRVKVVDTSTDKSIYVNLTPEQRKLYTDAGVFTKDGIPIKGGEKKLSSGSILLPNQILDIDKDGNLEYLLQSVYNGTYNSDSVINYIIVYTMKDGKLTYKDIICQANRFLYDENYIEPEPYNPQLTNIQTDRLITIIPFSGEITPEGRFIKADEVIVRTPFNTNNFIQDDYCEYRIDEFDNNLINYSLSDDCVFLLLSPNSSIDYYAVDFKEFLNFVESKKSKDYNIPSVRMFYAKLTNGKITELRYHFTP